MDGSLNEVVQRIKPANADDLNSILRDLSSNPAKLDLVLQSDAIHEQLVAGIDTSTVDTFNSNASALAWVAINCKNLRSHALKIAEEKLPETPEMLDVYTKLMKTGDLDIQFNKELITKILRVLEYKGENHKKYHAIALLLLKLASKNSDCAQYIIDYVKTDQSSSSYTIIGSLYTEIPSLVSLIVEPSSPVPDEFIIMLSSLSNDKTNREQVVPKYLNSLPESKDIAHVVRAKMFAGTTDQNGDLSSAAKSLDELSRDFFETEKLSEVTLEGLICSSSLPSVRKRLCSSDLISSLCAFASERPDLLYPILSVLVQLVKYPMPDPLAKEEELRRKALGVSVFQYQAKQEEYSDPKRNQTVSLVLASAVLKTKFLSFVSTTFITPSTASQLSLLLMELAMHQTGKIRESLASQNAIIIAAFLYTRLPHEDEAQKYAASAMAKILTSVPYQIATIEHKVPVDDILVPLSSQLMREDSKFETLDTFESLRALTNLCSWHVDSVNRRIYDLCKEKLDTLLKSSITAIQTATVEVYCNLSNDEEVARDFSTSLIDTLSMYLRAEEPCRLAAGGALGTYIDWPFATAKMIEAPNCIPNLVKAIDSYASDENMMIRVLTCIKGLLDVPEGVTKLKSLDITSKLNLIKLDQLKPLVQSCLVSLA